jgi:CheY-like chemotaxis protein
MYNVLVVEDDPVSADLMTMVLMRMPGLLVDAVGTAGHAREALASDKHYSMIITDVHLPGEDGLSLAEAIPAMPGRSNVPVIVVTGEPADVVKPRASAAGVRAFLRKPWSASQLRETVNSILNAT